MTLSDWAFYIGTSAIDWLHPMIYIAGFTVGVWAFWKSRKVGYLLVAICFLLVLSSRFIVPVVNRAISTRWPAQPELSPEVEQEYMQEMMALDEKYFPSGRVMSRKLTLPLDQIILVLGLWMLAKHESRRITEPCAAPNGGPAAPVADSRLTEGPPR
jgi:hypothetical protein